MTRKPETIAFWRGRLPHWEVADGRYFVTIHLAGAIPLQGQKRVQAIADELRKAPRQTEERRLQVQRRIFAEMELWLDRAEHVDHLRRSDVAEMIVEAIAFREGRDWHMFEFVVMPSHIHLFFEISGNSSHGQDMKRPGFYQLIRPDSGKMNGSTTGRDQTKRTSRFASTFVAILRRPN
jgi:hypothetical protein